MLEIDHSMGLISTYYDMEQNYMPVYVNQIKQFWFFTQKFDVIILPIILDAYCSLTYMLIDDYFFVNLVSWKSTYRQNDIVGSQKKTVINAGQI